MTAETASVVLTCDCTSITRIWMFLPLAMRLLQTDMLVTRGETLEGLELVAASEGVEDAPDLLGVGREGRDETAMVGLEFVAVSDGLEDALSLTAVDEHVAGGEEETDRGAGLLVFAISEVFDGILDLLEVRRDVSEEAELMSVSMAMDELDDLRRRD